MKIISFHLRGKMAHFRRYYSNSSALSYSIPPRTTLVGIIAGLLGWERDSYYDKFSLDLCRIAVASRCPVKKCMQKLNLLMVKKAGDLNGSAEHHTQTATEFIIPQNIRTGIIDYKIWVHHRDKKIMEQLEQVITSGIPGYRSLGISVGLGTAFNLGWLENGGITEGEDKKEGGNIPAESVIPVEKIIEIQTEQMGAAEYRLVKEEIPLEFDSQRQLTERGLGNMIINLNGDPVPVKVKSYTQLETGSFIMWME
ncbi:CRISPR-associated protein Cas5h [Desulfohalotomaculum tongense]|uniref:CRISPR-associated protein Cas5 n=1 Tax=Desulforadius tongensis TaxID=1216062 RepID=UPI00195793FD|nr:CRISPR-associated protein Cas5 [Desulforadius tongensis]MBM7854572.1 CRISPR-associated protein Cas5h [Desulforadius tongensis]